MNSMASRSANSQRTLGNFMSRAGRNSRKM